MPRTQRTLKFETTFNSYTSVGPPLGEGGAGRVYEVSDEAGQRFALKLLHAASTTQRQRFKNEIAFCAKRSSPRIVSVLDHGFVGTSEGRCPFYVMPLYRGTLRTLLRERISPTEVLPLFSQMLDGVEAAHLQNVIHRDLKPENVLHDPASRQLVVADFGIARFTEELLLTAVETRDQDRLANFVYAAPEQRVRGRVVGPGADIYALGLMLNEMFTGEVLQGTGHRTIATIAERYAYLDPLVDLMVRNSPEERPAKIAEIKKELISRDNYFVSQQRLSRLKGTVIPETEVDDPLIENPIRAIGVDYSDDGRLEFRLDRAPSAEWIRAFQTLGNYRSVLGSEPARFQFQSDRALVGLPGIRYPSCRWLPTTLRRMSTRLTLAIRPRSSRIARSNTTKLFENFVKGESERKNVRK